MECDNQRWSEGKDGQKSKDRSSPKSFIRNRVTHASIENRLLNKYDIPENLGNFIVELLCKQNTDKTSVIILTFGHNVSEILLYFCGKH